MNTPPRDNLETELAQLTRWDRPAPGHRKHALDRETPPPTARTHPLLRIPRAPLAAAALILLAVTIGIAILPTLHTRDHPPLAATDDQIRDPGQGMTMWSQARQDPPPTSIASRAESQQRARFQSADAPAHAEVAEPGLFESARRMRKTAPPSPDRHIVRRITLELYTKDVRAVFAQASLIPSAARGEYIQASSITGEHESARAELTLRIAADRLDDCLRELRELGTVHAQRATGEDITTQIIDLDARLRSEQRIETELLALLDTRDDAPLADIMQVRDSLNQVRQRIEQLHAQQQNLSRLVSLATVLVILRPPPDNDQPPPGALGDYFKDTLARSWHTGTLYLADSTGFLVTILVGGLIVWIPAAAATGLVIHRRRANITRGRI